MVAAEISPGNAGFPRVAAICQKLSSLDAKHVAYINLLPIHATGCIGGYGFTNDDAQFPQIVKDYDEAMAKYFKSAVPPTIPEVAQYYRERKIAAVKSLCAPAFAYHGPASSTGGSAMALVVNGPIAPRLGINSGNNAFGQGHRPNATIGRAVRLIMMNVMNTRPGLLDRATLGNPGKYSFCFAEDESGARWESFADLFASSGIGKRKMRVVDSAATKAEPVWSQPVSGNFFSVLSSGFPGRHGFYNADSFLVATSSKWTHYFYVTNFSMFIYNELKNNLSANTHFLCNGWIFDIRAKVFHHRVNSTWKFRHLLYECKRLFFFFNHFQVGNVNIVGIAGYISN